MTEVFANRALTRRLSSHLRVMPVAHYCVFMRVPPLPLPQSSPSLSQPDDTPPPPLQLSTTSPQLTQPVVPILRLKQTAIMSTPPLQPPAIPSPRPQPPATMPGPTAPLILTATTQTCSSDVTVDSARIDTPPVLAHCS